MEGGAGRPARYGIRPFVVQPLNPLGPSQNVKSSVANWRNVSRRRSPDTCSRTAFAMHSRVVSYLAAVPAKGAGMTHWRERLFAAMSRNAGSAVEFFELPSNGVMEIGTRVRI